ncbi:Transient receptor potential calcium channel [Abortiporus biennis]
MPEEQSERERQPLLRQGPDVDTTEVYPIIQMIRLDAMHFIDTPLTYEALSAPDLTYTLIRPLEDKYNAIQRQGNLSVVFCFLINRAYFLRDHNLTTSSLSRSRAALCEILATRTLKSHAHSMIELSLALTTSWPVYTGADPQLLDRFREERDDDVEERVGNAIEMAIISQAKRFIKSSACQKVIDGIWSGKIVYQAESSRSILSDTYKRNPIHFYDPHKAPLLDHYRLKVPAIRSVLEYMNFLVLFILFIAALEFSERDTVNWAEAIFMIYALGFSLEKIAAMQEHGLKVYSKGTWNGFDLAFVTLFCTYGLLRLYGVYDNKLWARNNGIDFLAVIAVLMFPRLAFVTLKNNLMVLSLRAMIVQFTLLMLIAVFCFGGFLYALWTLSRNEAGFTAGQIAWWMLDLWFGLDASGFDNATKFHPIFGPFMMITYACLSNTLLLTVLVSILSNTFTTINEDAAAEAMFRRAVSTIEGVKADSLFSYQPPVNLVALCIMLPASYILSPRWFHKVNVFMIRSTSFPILLFIALYERQAKKSGATNFYETVSYAAEKLYDTLPRGLKRLALFDGLMTGSDADIDAIFELEEEFENESALDMQEAQPLSPLEIRQRRMSVASRRHVSGSSTAGQHNHPSQPSQPSPSSSPRKIHRSPSSSPRKAELPSPNAPSAPLPHPPLPHPRQRINSILSRNLDLAQSSPSPLAQIFQPLIVDDEFNDMNNTDQIQLQNQMTNGTSSNPDQQQQSSVMPPAVSILSYGPATRRRLSSLTTQRRNPSQIGSSALGLVSSTTFPGDNSNSSGGPPLRRPPIVGGSGTGNNIPQWKSGLSRIASVAQPLSESPDEHLLATKELEDEGRPGETGETSEEPQQPETATEVEDGGSMSGVWMHKLQKMEETQKRMEEMLIRLSRKLDGASSR